MRVIYTFSVNGKLITWVAQAFGWRFGFRRSIGSKPFALKLYRFQQGDV